MKPWTQLVPLSPFPWHSKSLQSLLKKLNHRIDELLAARAACDAELRALAVAPIETIEPDRVAPLEAKAARASDRFGVLQQEIQLRHDLAGFFDEQNAARRKARDEAVGVRHDLMATVRRGLVSVGYVDADTPQRGWITPDMVERHPAVAEARERIDELSTEDEAAGHNRKAWDVIAEELEAIRRAAVGPF